MTDRRSQQKLTDDDVRLILTSEETPDTLALALGVVPYIVYFYRARRSKRAIRIARELGLLSSRSDIVGSGLEKDSRAYVVNGKVKSHG